MEKVNYSNLEENIKAIVSQHISLINNIENNSSRSSNKIYKYNRCK